MYTQNRNELRQMYFDTWKKHQEKTPLSPLEFLVADVIQIHPEYQKLLTTQNEAIDKDFAESNPFLHMSLHIALREQIRANTPTDITIIYNSLLERSGDTHAVEHQMIECLAEALWKGQQSKQAPDPAPYLECLKQLL